MTAKKDNIFIRVVLDPKTFTDFSVFNTFIRNKNLKQPLLFMGIMILFAVVCFLSGKPQGTMTGIILTIAGLALPAYSLLRFIGSTRASIKAHGLPRAAYEILLTGNTAEIKSLAESGDSVSIKWEDFHHAYRNTHCIYLYLMPQRAFLLPDGQAEGASTEEVWDWLVTHMETEKISDVRKSASSRS